MRASDRIHTMICIEFGEYMLNLSIGSEGDDSFQWRMLFIQLYFQSNYGANYHVSIQNNLHTIW